MSATSQKAVDQFVCATIAGYCGLGSDGIKDSLILGRPPLSLDANKLTYLAMSLRGYIQSHNAVGTIRASEIKKPKMTLRELADLVYKRIQ